MQNKSSGIFKILGVIGAVILFFVLQSFFPSFTTIFLVIAGIFLFLRLSRHITRRARIKYFVP